MSEYTDEQLEHFFQKWLYTYGGATDVISLEQFIKDYDTHKAKEEEDILE